MWPGRSEPSRKYNRKYNRQEGAILTPASGGRRGSAEPPFQASRAGNKASPLGPPSAGKRPETPGPAAGNHSPALWPGHLTAVAPCSAPPRRKMVTQRPHHQGPCANPAQPRQPLLRERKPLLATRQRGPPQHLKLSGAPSLPPSYPLPSHHPGGRLSFRPDSALHFLCDPWGE